MGCSIGSATNTAVLKMRARALAVRERKPGECSLSNANVPHHGRLGGFAGENPGHSPFLARASDAMVGAVSFSLGRSFQQKLHEQHASAGEPCGSVNFLSSAFSNAVTYFAAIAA